MTDVGNQKRPRKGTYSCLECRQAKVRCLRLTPEAKLCRRCEERGWSCTTQLVSQSRPRQTVSARSRLKQLESKLANLSQEVRHVESRLESQHVPVEELKEDPSLESEEQGDDSCLQDVLADTPASHLRSLFQNSLLSTQAQQNKGSVEVQPIATRSPLLERAKVALTRLIPSKAEVRELAEYASVWLSLLHDILPQPFVVTHQHEVLDNYEKMTDSNVDVMSLASWLLTISITAEQMAQEGTNSAHLLSLSQAISICVEKFILAYDKLVGTFEGLGVGMLFLRLQISRGNFLKVWIRLRRFIAIAELMGLPKTSQAVWTENAAGKDLEKTQTYKAQLWLMITTAERLCAMFLDLLPTARNCGPPRAGLLMMRDGVVDITEYFRRLTDIAANFQQVNELSNQNYSSTLEIDKSLRNLASSVPRTWWDETSDEFKSDRIVQFLHCFIVARVHLSFALRKDMNEQYLYSRRVCVDACESVAQRYLSIRQKLPTGIFVGQLLDLQAFTAVIVLLLLSYDQSHTEHIGVRKETMSTDNLVGEVTRVMREKSTNCSGFDYARSGVDTIHSLNMLLLQNDGAAQLTLKIPIVGTLHVSRGSLSSENSSNERRQVRSATAQDSKDSRLGLPSTSRLADQNMQEELQIDWSIQNEFVNYLLEGTNVMESANEDMLWPEIQM